MATNKELVEQAVGAIPKWMAFLDRKQAEQNLILEQMQDDEAQFAPKSLTQRLTDRFKSKPESEAAEPAETEVKDDQEQVEPQDQQDKVKLEKEENQKEEEVVVKETPVPSREPVSSESNEPVSSDNNQINKKGFSDLF